MMDFGHQASASRWTVLILFFAGFSIRITLALWMGLGNPPPLGSDPREYDVYAWNLAQGHGYRGLSPDVEDQDHPTAYRVPGTSIVWAGLYVVFGRRYDVVRIANCLAGALAVVLTYRIGRRCYSEQVGLIAAAAYAILPTALIYTVDLLSEPLGTLWFLLYILASLTFAEHQTWGRAAVAGLMLGLATLTRPNCFFMLPLAGLWALV